MLWLPVSFDGTATVGLYRFTFGNILAIENFPKFQLPYVGSIGGKKFTIEKIETDTLRKTATVSLRINENPLPIAVIVGGIVIILGLTAGYFSLQKVEKLIDNPAVNIFILAIAILIIFGIARFIKR